MSSIIKSEKIKNSIYFPPYMRFSILFPTVLLTIFTAIFSVALNVAFFPHLSPLAIAKEKNEGVSPAKFTLDIKFVDIADSAYRRGNYEKAEELLFKELEYNYSSVNTHRKLGDLHLLKKNYEKALDEYNLAKNFVRARNPTPSKNAPCRTDADFPVYLENLYDLGLSSFELSKIFERQGKQTQQKQALSIAEASLAQAFGDLPVFRYTAPVEKIVGFDKNNSLIIRVKDNIKPQENKFPAEIGLHLLNSNDFNLNLNIISKYRESEKDPERIFQTDISSSLLNKYHFDLGVYKNFNSGDIGPIIEGSSPLLGGRLDIGSGAFGPTIGYSSPLFGGNMNISTNSLRSRIGVEFPIGSCFVLGCSQRKLDSTSKIGIQSSSKDIPANQSPVSSLSKRACLRNDLPEKIENRITKLLQRILISEDKEREALLIAEAGRTIEVDKFIAQNLEKIDPNKANKFKDFVADLTFDRILKTLSRKITLVNYSIVSDKELFVWVINPINAHKKNSAENLNPIAFRKLNCDKIKNFDASISSNHDRCSFLKGVDWEDQGNPSEVNRQVIAKVDVLRNSSLKPEPNILESPHKLKRLYQLLIQNIEDLLPTDESAHIVFIPDGHLISVPFAALQSENSSYLIDHHTISVAPSLRSLLYNRHISDKKIAQTALVAGRPIMIPLLDLPKAEMEANGVSNILLKANFTVNKFLGKHATKKAIREHLDSSSIIHLATHGRIASAQIPECPLTRSAEISPYPFNQLVTQCSNQGHTLQDIDILGELAFTPSNNDTGQNRGWLNAQELLKENLEGVNLAVLSACYSVRGSLTSGEVMGLPFAFNLAGVHNIIASTSSVIDDQGTVFLMEKFYEKMLEEGRHTDISQSLREAMLDTKVWKNKEGKTPYSAPKYWAEFTLIGIGSESILAGSKSSDQGSASDISLP